MAGLRSGVLVGVAMALVFVLAQYAVPAHPVATPESYLTDIVFFAGAMFFAYRYRQHLPERRVTLKELLLFGLWLGITAAAVYGLLLWVYCIASPSMAQVFIDQRVALMPPASDGAEQAMAVDAVRHYEAADWGLIGGFRSFVMSVIMTFIAAVIFRTEKAPIRQKEIKQNK